MHEYRSDLPVCMSGFGKNGTERVQVNITDGAIWCGARRRPMTSTPGTHCRRIDLHSRQPGWGVPPLPSTRVQVDVPDCRTLPFYLRFSLSTTVLVRQTIRTLSKCPSTASSPLSLRFFGLRVLMRFAVIVCRMHTSCRKDTRVIWEIPAQTGQYIASKYSMVIWRVSVITYNICVYIKRALW